MVEHYDVVWTKRSQQHMKQIFEYISKDSPQNAIKVLKDIVFAANKASLNPGYYPSDKYKTNNDGSYRAFEKHGYRISYRFSGKVVRVLRVRYAGREPKEY